MLNPQHDETAIQYFDSSSDIKAILQALDSSPFFNEHNIIIAKDLKIFQDKLSSKVKEDEHIFLNYITNMH